MGYDLEGTDDRNGCLPRVLLTAPYVFDVPSAGGNGRVLGRTCSFRTWASRPRAPSARGTGQDAGRLRPAHPGDARRGGRSQPGRDGSLPRRPDRRALRPPPTSLERTHGVVGFFGASSMERLPTEVAITERCAASKPSRLTIEEETCPRSSSTRRRFRLRPLIGALIKPLVAKANTDNPAMSMLHVVLLPGKGHDRHNHPDADEILYILSGHGDQMVDGRQALPLVAAGQLCSSPQERGIRPINTGWETQLTLLAIYGPSGAEEALRGPAGLSRSRAGKTAGLSRA